MDAKAMDFGLIQVRQMKRTVLAVAAAVAWQGLGAPALAVEITDGHLHLVQVDHPIWVEHMYPGRRFWRPWRYGWNGYVTEGHVTEIYLAHGPFRISESEFLQTIAAGGQSPSFIQGIRDRQAAAGVQGTLAIVGWTGALIASSLAQAGVGQVNFRVGAAPISFNTPAVGAIALGVMGLIDTIGYFADTAPRGAPFFDAFTPSEAQEAIDAYNRHYDQTHPTLPS
ncbi:MAG: hypothetical protein KGR26_08125, partial [Cyanobacteria bacterium REEB65]|nr:hypothetical protein [Cyanobacteria bacterium REEB65]